MNTVTEWLCKQEKNALAVQLELIIIQVHGNVGSTYSSIGNNNISNIIQVSLNVILCILVQYSGWFVDVSHGRSHSVGTFWSQQLWIKGEI